MAANADGKIFIKTSKEGDKEAFPAQEIYKHIKTSFVKDNIDELASHFDYFEGIKKSDLRLENTFKEVWDRHQKDPENRPYPSDEDDRTRVEEWICKKTWLKGIKYSDFGEIVDFQIPLKTPGKSKEQKGLGKIDLLAVKGNIATILEAKVMMERPNGKIYDNSEHPLKAFLEVYTYWKQVGGENAPEVFRHPGIEGVEKVDKAVLFFRESAIHRKFGDICKPKNETDKKIKAFLRRLDVKVYTVVPSQEDRWVFTGVKDETDRLND